MTRFGRAGSGRLPALRPALVGFDDFRVSDLPTRVATVVLHDSFGIGQAAVRLVLRHPEGDATPVRHITLRTKRVPRGPGEVGP